MKYCEKYDIKPKQVLLEILENIESLNSLDAIEQISSLRGHGFKVMVDDFGSKNSNFSRLLEFCPEYIKIDGEFIKNIVEDKRSQIIVEAIVDVCHKSGIKVIAEYVHSKEVFQKVIDMGIDYSQGFYLGKPEATIDIDDAIKID